MVRELKRIDVSRVPELLSLAEEVRRTSEPRVLGRDGEDIAIVVPVKPARRPQRHARVKADREAFFSSAGSWKEIVDTDKLVSDIYESRRHSLRPPAEL